MSKKQASSQMRNDHQEDVIEPLSCRHHFSVILTKSHVQSTLHIPTKLQGVLPRRKLRAVLTRRGKTWEMEYLGGDPRPRFSTAWKHFVNDNNLKMGDACVFELLHLGNETVKFKVQILRGDIPDELLDKIDSVGESSDNPITLD